MTETIIATIDANAELMTLKQAADRVDVHYNTLKNWRRKGWLVIAGRSAGQGRAIKVTRAALAEAVRRAHEIIPEKKEQPNDNQSRPPHP